MMCGGTRSISLRGWRVVVCPTASWFARRAVPGSSASSGSRAWARSISRGSGNARHGSSRAGPVRAGPALEAVRDAGTTLLLVDQMAALAPQIADRGYVLASGAIVHAGDAATLSRDPELEGAYLGRI